MKSVNWNKVDKFYVVLVVTLALLSILLIVTFRSLFSAYLTAYEIDQKELAKGVRVDVDKLDEAYSFSYTKKTLPLEIR
jgi:hypothetical protein